MSFIVLLPVVIVLLLVLILIFEIAMFIDVLKNPHLSDTERILWAGGMLIVHPFVAIVYYLVAHSRLYKS